LLLVAEEAVKNMVLEAVLEDYDAALEQLAVAARYLLLLQLALELLIQ
jgi:hypothetical protein